MAKKKEVKRPEHYEKSTLKINGTFDDVIKASFLGKPPAKKQDK